MEIVMYFEPISNFIIGDNLNLNNKMLGNSIIKYTANDAFPSLDDIDIAIIGVKEDRASEGNKGCSTAPDFIRKELYKLYQISDKIRIVDLGDIKSGFNISDTYFAVTFVLSELIKAKILPIILGGSQDLTYANYLAYEKIGQIVNIVAVDHSFDLGKPDDEVKSDAYMNKIILRQPNFLFNYTNIGYQTYLVDNQAIELMNKLFFDTYRLGVIQKQSEETEPIVRNADMVSFDVSSIRWSDAPANENPKANGFYGEEACQIARYAGMSDKLSSIGFYELNPVYDIRNQTSQLVAQVIWYFIDGFNNRKYDYPIKDKETDKFIKYRVVAKEGSYEMVFYKSKSSDRWWMEIPCPIKNKLKFEKHYLVPCSYFDYQVACNQEIPDRWWQFYQKMM